MLDQRKIVSSFISSILLIAVITVLFAGSGQNDRSGNGYHGVTVASASTMETKEESAAEVSTAEVSTVQMEEVSEAWVSTEEKEETGEAAEEMTPGQTETTLQETQAQETTVQETTTAPESIFYAGMDFGPEIAMEALLRAEEQEILLLDEETDRIGIYHGERFVVTAEEYEALLRIVEAEAGGENVEGRMLVASVVLNRVNYKRFPDDIIGVIFQKNQFSPVASGRYYKVKITKRTVEAVDRVLAGEDISQGAMYFMRRSKANPDAVTWFDTKLTFLFKHGKHEFFK